MSIQHYLKGFALALATPNAENEGHFDVGKIHEVLAEMHHQLVHEGGGYVVPLCCDVAQAAQQKAKGVAEKKASF